MAYFYKDEPVEQNIYKWHIQVEWGDERLPQFTEDFSRISYCGDTITYDGALQLAAYMGFKEIYLLGTDCCQYESGKQHFVDNYVGILSFTHYIRFIMFLTINSQNLP